MSNIKKVQCSKCGIWLIPEESVHSLYNSGECKVTCLDCAPAGRTISHDAIKGGRELENISKLFGIMSDVADKNPELKKKLRGFKKQTTLKGIVSECS